MSRGSSHVDDVGPTSGSREGYVISLRGLRHQTTRPESSAPIDVITQCYVVYSVARTLVYDVTNHGIFTER